MFMTKKLKFRIKKTICIEIEMFWLTNFTCKTNINNNSLKIHEIDQTFHRFQSMISKNKIKAIFTI